MRFIRRFYMHLELTHHKLEVYTQAQRVAEQCNLVTKNFPDHEKFGMTLQVRRASLSVLINISEGFARKTILGRRRFFVIARASLIKLDTALNFALRLNYITQEFLDGLKPIILAVFRALSALLKSLERSSVTATGCLMFLFALMVTQL